MRKILVAKPEWIDHLRDRRRMDDNTITDQQIESRIGFIWLRVGARGRLL
jgi:hypothetical protein